MMRPLQLLGNAFARLWIGAVALLAYDAMLLSVALAAAARGGSATAREVFDALS